MDVVPILELPYNYRWSAVYESNRPVPVRWMITRLSISHLQSWTATCRWFFSHINSCTLWFCWLFIVLFSNSCRKFSLYNLSNSQQTFDLYSYFRWPWNSEMSFRHSMIASVERLDPQFSRCTYFYWHLHTLFLKFFYIYHLL